MSKARRRLLLAVAVAGIATLVATIAFPNARADTNPQLTVMDYNTVIYGLTPAAMNSKNTIGAWYRYYHSLWRLHFPGMQINEIQTTGDSDEVTKTLLSVNAGNPPDLIAVHGQLPLLVERHAVENLDSYYKAAGITPSYFLKPLADAVRYNGHWYGLPGASTPSYGNLIYIPKLVRAAGIKTVPITWNGLFAASKKVVKFDSSGNLVRIGLPVDTGLYQIDLFCGKPTTYSEATNSFHPSAPCVKAYFAFEMKLVKLYGGYAKYTKFISGDPTVWSCSPKAYIPTGKILFTTDAYWTGGQMDTCYDVVWKLGPPPTPHGLLSEWSALGPVAWVMAIPRGAKNPQLAFDFVKFTIWEHGDLLGPTTNGYVRATQGPAWANGLIANEAKVRRQHGYPGNPMASAMKIVEQGAILGRGAYPKTPVVAYYTQQMSRAWQEVAFGRASISSALDEVQKLVDDQMKLQPSTIG